MLPWLVSQILACLALATLLGLAIGWVLRGQLQPASNAPPRLAPSSQTNGVDVQVDARTRSVAQAAGVARAQVEQLQAMLARTEAKLDGMARERATDARAQHYATAFAQAQARAAVTDRDRLRRQCQQQKATAVRIHAQLEAAVEALRAEQDRRCEATASIGERDATILQLRQQLSFSQRELNRLREAIHGLRAEARRMGSAERGAKSATEARTSSSRTTTRSSTSRVFRDGEEPQD